MRKLLTGLAILSTLAYAGVSQAADGVVNMTWDTCTGPVDKTPVPSAPLNLNITVLGIDQLHKAYDVRVIYGNATQTVPDAWRFDSEGCMATLLTQNVSAKVCPAFHQTGAGALQIKKVQFSPPEDPYAQTLMQVLLANAYGAVATVDPGTRYLLEQISFNLTDAVEGSGTPGLTCGGLEQPMCFKLSYATYLDLNGLEIPFGRADPALSVTTNGATASPCASVPAQAKTWGAIKNQYRN